MAALDAAAGNCNRPVAGRNGQVFISSATRPPIGKFGGVFAEPPATTLGGLAIRAAMEPSAGHRLS